MVTAPEYTLQVQSKVVLALFALHNFIQVHDPDDLNDQDWEGEIERRPPVPATADLGS